MKKILFILALLSSTLSSLAYDFTYKNVNYTIIDKTAKTCRTDTTKKGNGGKEITNLHIPERAFYGGIEYTVVEIGDGSFKECINLESVKMGSWVKRIGREAFYGCTRLQYVTLPTLLEEIGDSAFCRCNSAYGTPIYHSPTLLELPRNVKHIGSGAFKLARNFIFSELPPFLTEIADYAFCKCDFINSRVDIPKSVTRIGQRAFAAHGAGLSFVEIPSGVTSIGAGAFMGNGFSSCTLPPALAAIEDDTFSHCWHLSDINIPLSVKRIGARAFKECDLVTLKVPEGVINIEDEAFSDNRKLNEISLPSSLTHIGKYAFKSAMFKSINLPVALKGISEGVFWGVNSLTSLQLPTSVTYIGDSAFEGCKSMTTIILNNGLESIGNTVFRGCESLTSITIPSTVRTIGGGCFIDCESLSKIDVDPGNKFIKQTDGILFDNEMGELIACITPIEGNYTVPSTIKEIKSYAFYNQKGLSGITLPEGLTKIGDHAFTGCAMLLEINIPPLVSEIYDYTFSDCTMLSKAIIPSSISGIGVMAFSGCALSEATIPEGVRIADRIFQGNQKLETVMIYGKFDYVNAPFSDCHAIKHVYYITATPQEDDGVYIPIFSSHWHHSEYEPGDIYWDFITYKDIYAEYENVNNIYFKYPSATLYVQESVYDEIKNGKLLPWSYFNNIEIYNPSEDPFGPGAVEEINSEISNLIPTEVYTLSGVKVADSADNLQPGIYILRKGSKTEKFIVR